MKRTLSLVLALVLAASLFCMTGCFNSGGAGGAGNGGGVSKGDSSFINSLGGVSETYMGGLSEEVYSSADDAAEAYVVNEVVGEKDAEILETESKGELSDEQIEEAGIPAEFLTNADCVEEIEVTYAVYEESLDSGITLLSSGKLDKTKKVRVYVIKCGPDWSYFTPRPVTGETIQKSYYDSVFNSEKYENCTFKNVSEVYADVSASANGETIKQQMTMTMEQLIKYDDGKIYLEQTTIMEGMGMDSTTKIYAYMETVDGEPVCYVKTSEDGDWYEGYLTAIGFGSIEELTPFYGQYLDYTYFTKTDFGFELSDDNAAAYFEEAMAQALGSMADMLGEGMKLDMKAEYYVQDGVLSGMMTDADITMNVKEAGQTASIKETVKGTTTCTNYGTTVVEKPFED